MDVTCLYADGEVFLLILSFLPSPPILWRFDKCPRRERNLYSTTKHTCPQRSRFIARSRPSQCLVFSALGWQSNCPRYKCCDRCFAETACHVYARRSEDARRGSTIKLAGFAAVHVEHVNVRAPHSMDGGCAHSEALLEPCAQSAPKSVLEHNR